MIEYCNQKIVVKFKSVWKLLRYLPHAVDELQKYRGSVCIRMVVIAVSDSLKEMLTLYTALRYKIMEWPEY